MIDLFGIKANKRLGYYQNRLYKAVDLMEQANKVIKAQSAKIAMLESQLELSQYSTIDFPNSTED